MKKLKNFARQTSPAGEVRKAYFLSIWELHHILSQKYEAEFFPAIPAKESVSPFNHVI